MRLRQGRLSKTALTFAINVVENDIQRRATWQALDMLQNAVGIATPTAADAH